MKKIQLLLLFILLPFIAKSEIVMPSIFSDNMVLQRDTVINVWGWADKKEKVMLTFNGNVYKASADNDGKWLIKLPSTPFGGPYQMVVSGKVNSLTFNNILIGDVWLCSGQSNMEWVVKNSNNAAKEIASANYPTIRSFNVEHKIGLEPQKDLNGKWEVCTPASVASFSAVAYFFARELYRETKVPIAIINSSWGGTDIETWISGKSFDALPDKFKARYNNSASFKAFSADDNRKAKKAYEEALLNDAGLSQKWYDDNYSYADWKDITVPSLWKSTPLGDVIGIAWFKQTFDLKNIPNEKAMIFLGPIDDQDTVWINGVEIGSTNVYNAQRVYDIPLEVLKKGINTITVRVVNTQGGGGMYGKPEDLFVQTNNTKIAIDGIWKYKASVINKDFGYIEETPNSAPSLLFNAMINPITNLSIKGAIWYQGENNASAAYNYRTLFPYMINDWRKQWGDDFPFYWVQLANFMAANAQPSESEWAELREAQSMTLSVPKTGQAVITDIGDANDIHPRNKQDVGRRLALIALNKDYGKSEVVYSGPTLKSVETNGNKMILTFDNVGSGLNVNNKYGYVQGFSIAGADKHFVWAKAYLNNGKIVVYSDQISQPVAVRYNWENNPDGNVYNKDGLPMGLFRTDSWKGLTEK